MARVVPGTDSRRQPRGAGRPGPELFRRLTALARGLLYAMLLASLLPAAACSRHRVMSRPPAVPATERNERVFTTNQEAVEAGIYEEFVDSLTLKGQAPAAGAEARPAVSGAQLPSDLALGYRVQVGAFREQGPAEQHAEQVRQSAGNRYPVYVRFYDPLWKVQVGDCPTREEAARVEAFLKNNGYPESWVVSSGIKR